MLDVIKGVETTIKCDVNDMAVVSWMGNVYNKLFNNELKNWN